MELPINGTNGGGESCSISRPSDSGFYDDKDDTFDSDLTPQLDDEEEEFGEDHRQQSGSQITSDPDEQQHFFDVFNTFRYYKSAMNRRIARSRAFIDQMPPQHQEKLARYRKHLEELNFRVAHNHEVIKVVIADVASMFKNAVYMQNKQLVVKSERELDTGRINSVLHQVVREWTAQGAAERATCFDPIINALERHFPKVDGRHKVKVLVPGAGLGRLAFDIASRGFSCQGNEFSLMMLFVANFILNKCKEANCYLLYPWVSDFCNNLTSDHQLASVTFPDISPTTIPDHVNFSMAAGSFTEIFADCRAEWDCVATCFFIDTAPNVITYIETIADILRPGGLWINFGPLLYHYADMAEPSVEPSYDIVRDIIKSSGFEFVEEETNLNSYYTRNPNSMLSYQYKSVYFVCRRK